MKLSTDVITEDQEVVGNCVQTNKMVLTQREEAHKEAGISENHQEQNLTQTKEHYMINFY